MLAEGQSRKMLTELRDTIAYTLRLGEHRVALNPLIGQRFKCPSRAESPVSNVVGKPKVIRSRFLFPVHARLPHEL